MDTAIVDLETASFQQLRTECRARKIEFARTDKKEDLVEKLKADSVSSLKDQQTLITDDIETHLTELDIDKAPFIKKEPQTVDGHKLSDVLDECNRIFAGRAQAKYNEDNPTMIEFHGGPRQRYDVTISQFKKSILMFARTFSSPALTSAKDIGTLEGNALGDLNLASMTPSQKAKLADQLRDLLGE